MHSVMHVTNPSAASRQYRTVQIANDYYTAWPAPNAQLEFYRDRIDICCGLQLKGAQR